MLSGSFRPSCQPSSRPWLGSSKANSHSPVRFNHSSRTNCGRGYSGRGNFAASDIGFLPVLFTRAIRGFNHEKIRHAPGGLSIPLFNEGAKITELVPSNKIDGATAKTSAGHARRKCARMRPCQLDHDVELGTSYFIVIAQ